MAKPLPVALMGLAVVASIILGARGVTASEMLKDVEVAPIPGRVGGLIRSYLILESTGAGQAKTPQQYRLEVVLQESLMSTLVDADRKVSDAVYSVQATFRLIDAKERKVVLQGTSHARATFGSVYANVRAREDAEDRAARTIADDLKTRLSAYLSRPQHRP
jgi:LPS-assembly lipoprotein